MHSHGSAHGAIFVNDRMGFGKKALKTLGSS
jgi:hypothetical protein